MINQTLKSHHLKVRRRKRYSKMVERRINHRQESISKSCMIQKQIEDSISKEERLFSLYNWEQYIKDHGA